ncbi:hypothetical protein NXT08_22485 [Rhodococcus pyridinivorans]|uniref:hypothetical protein n=1 Tax=Rhodococcus pyridinivorans TaxID=103816 RepID=UPI000BA29B8C|nr:hypothetical protein [Rhodococcus pyridinivorans]UVT24972.1 hypothetical protein NXT08_22485 [Rhodococcus pyridinivorans]
MARQNTFRLDRAGVGEILKSDPVRAMCNGVAEQVAGIVRAEVGDDVEVLVRPYTLDRAAASVVIADPEGALMQARDGNLTRAAAAVGLEVRSR